MLRTILVCNHWCMLFFLLQVILTVKPGSGIILSWNGGAALYCEIIKKVKFICERHTVSPAAQKQWAHCKIHDNYLAILVLLLEDVSEPHAALRYNFTVSFPYRTPSTPHPLTPPPPPHNCTANKGAEACLCNVLFRKVQRNMKSHSSCKHRRPCLCDCM